ncbi:MAG TPA: hypothetical protein VFF52_25165 [Isosphaeraceae bacterium]|nr:hypothetical protein [Isosphaeraceae bacterium]
MMTLDEAWNWYVTTEKQLSLFGRIGRRHWDNLPWDGELGKDEKLKTLTSRDLVADADFSLDHLDDFAVLILFSAFESIIRDQARQDVQRERGRLSHPLVTRILDQAIGDIEQSSIFRVLEVFKGQDANLVEEVNQVRQYRNWVAHGRRGKPPFGIDPEIAYKRLKRFLDQTRPRGAEALAGEIAYKRLKRFLDRFTPPIAEEA